MRNYLAALLVVLALSTLCNSNGSPYSELWISTYQYSLKDVDSTWKAFEPVVYGGSGSYLIKYYELPVGWDYYDDKFPQSFSNSLFFPKDAPKGRYQVGVKVHDLTYKTTLDQYLILVLGDGIVSIFLRDAYDSYWDFGSNYKFDNKDIIKLPSWDQVVKLIQQGNLGQVEQIVKRVIDSDNSCDEKSAFLKGVISRIQEFIKNGEKLIEELKAEIAQLEKIIAQDKLLLENLKKVSYKNDTLKNLKWELDSAKRSYEFYRARAEYTKNDIAMYNELINQNKKEIWKIKDVDIPAIKASIAKLEGQVSDSLWSYKKMTGAEKNWWDFEINNQQGTLAKKKEMLKQAEVDLDVLQKKMDWYASKIVYLKLQLENDLKAIAPFAKKIEDLQKQIAALENTDEIEALNKKIAGNEGLIKVKLEKIKTIKWSITELSPSLKDFKMLAAKSEYDCRYIKTEEEKWADDKTYTTLKPDQFSGYIDNIYGKSSSKTVPKKDLYGVVDIDLYSSQWNKAYAPSSSYADFNCLTLQVGVASSGTVKRVGSKSIWVIENTVEIELQFTSCSVLQTVHPSGIIAPDSHIMWRGERSNLGRTCKVQSAIAMW